MIIFSYGPRLITAHLHRARSARWMPERSEGATSMFLVDALESSTKAFNVVSRKECKMSWIEDAKGANLPSDEEVAAGRREIAKAEHAKAIRELTAHLDTFLDDFRQAGYKVDITFIENPSAYVALIVSVRIENLAMLSISSGSSIEIVNIGSYQEAGADSEGYDDGTRFVPMHGFHNGILNDSVRGGSPAELIAKLKQKLFRMLSDIEKLRKSGRLITQEDAEKANKKGAEEVKKKLKKSKSWWR